MKKITPYSYLDSEVREALEGLGLSKVIDGEIHFEHPADSSHGDYATNVALILFVQLQKKNGQFKNPRSLAEAIAAKIKSSLARNKNNLIASVSVAGPGFINFTLSDQFLLEEMLGVIKRKGEIVSKNLKDKKIIVEYTDPNPFKEFHIGHLYSNIVGESICRLLESQGAEVQRVCYQGDAGMHVAKSVWGMKKKLTKDDLQIDKLEKLGLKKKVEFLGQAYALGATAFKEDKQAQEEIKDINYLTYLSAQETLQETRDWKPQVDYKQYVSQTKLNYQEIKELYQKGRAWSLEYFETIYERLGTRFDDYYFESLVGEFGVKIVNDFIKKGIFEKSKGAVIFPGEKYGLHSRVFINSLGLPTYEAKELGLAPEKYRRFQYDLSIIVTGNEIDEYFKVLIAALKQTNPKLGKITTHLSHGMVSLPEGKMSSRTGKIITGERLLDEARDRVVKIIKKTRSQFSSTQTKFVAEKVGLAAVKYALLKSNIGGDIAFSFEESLSFQGNSGPYLQYTFVRCKSVLDKVKLDINRPSDTLFDIKRYLDQQLNREERDVLRNLYQYSEVVNKATSEYQPHRLCTYLYQLAQSFNVFYGEHQIAGGTAAGAVSAAGAAGVDNNFRLSLTMAIATTLRSGLKLLGIETVDKM